jgi:hypothetical protein
MTELPGLKCSLTDAVLPVKWHSPAPGAQESFTVGHRGLAMNVD